jgi:hypothetical protein
MPLYITTIKLISGTDEDYNRLSDELRKKSFRTSYERKERNSADLNLPLVLAINQPTMLEVSTSILAAVSHTGKKFSYSVRKEKVNGI